MNPAEVLVIILSIFLVIFLFIGIVLGILLVRVTMQIRKVTASAERTAENIEHMTTNAAKASGNIAASKLVMSIIKAAMKARKK